MSRSYSIFEAKAKLSELLRQVKAGREITINERGKPIARLVPLGKTESIADHIDKLAMAGLAKKRTHFDWRSVYFEKRDGGLERFLKDRE